MSHPSHFSDDLSPAYMAAATRQQRAEVRAVERGRQARIDLERRCVRVASDSGNGTYTVTITHSTEGDPLGCACDCLDGRYRPGEGGCAHIGAAVRRLAREGLVAWDDTLAAHTPTAKAVSLGGALPRPTFDPADLLLAFEGLPSW